MSHRTARQGRPLHRQDDALSATTLPLCSERSIEEIAESLANHGIGTRRDRPGRAVELLREVAV
ncbi:hypothetical protein, partial [Streptomyces sp. NPDC005407]|uniref:hypothetical protein n=1 Tax=Streptomyces sp. NPDC005407 TaxID=3155340 RepID=UPI0033A2B44B